MLQNREFISAVFLSLDVGKDTEIKTVSLHSVTGRARRKNSVTKKSRKTKFRVLVSMCCKPPGSLPDRTVGGGGQRLPAYGKPVCTVREQCPVRHSGRQGRGGRAGMFIRHPGYITVYGRR